MKTQKLIVIVALVCLMAFFNVLSFAQTTPVQPDLAGSMAEVLAQSLAAQGYEVRLDGTSVKIATDRGELILDPPATGEELEDSGIGARLDPQADTSAEDPADSIDDFLQLRRCLDAADFLWTVSNGLCQIGVDDFGTFICRTRAAFDRIIASLECIATYVPQEPPTGDVVSVFVTTTEYQANLGGLAGADQKCQDAADAAQLGGTWTAWLSDSTENAIDRIPDGQYQLLDGTQVADDKADLTDGRLKAEIILAENGQELPGSVWTGTEANGNGTVSNCNNWTVNSSESVGDWGFNAYVDDFWTLLPPPDQCSQEYRLYCFGEGVE
jgi:hypothetical protein